MSNPEYLDMAKNILYGLSQLGLSGDPEEYLAKLLSDLADKVRQETIEECAKVAEDYNLTETSIGIAMNLRAKKINHEESK